MKTPIRLKIMNVILLLEIIMAPISIVFVIFMVTFDFSSESQLYHFQEGFISSIGLTRANLEDGNVIAEVAGATVGKFVFPLLFSILSYIYIKSRKFTPSMIFTVLLTILSLRSILSLFLNLLLVILLISSRRFFRKKDEIENVTVTNSN